MKRVLILLCVLLIPLPAAADTDADAAALVDAWLAAQNASDFAAYAALYDGKFIGIRRTSEGGEKKMKAKAWKADRKKMFKRTQKVAADERKVTAFEGGATVRFIQRWESGSYADHGTKVLRLQYDSKGVLKIAREELLSSTPGWDDDKSTVLDATALVAPITVRLQGEGIDDSGDGCASVTWVLYLKDSKKKVIQREVGTGDLVPDEYSDATTLKVEPSDTKGLLFDVGEWCAGGAVYYQVKRSGDALVVNYRGVGECGDDPDCDPETKATVLTIKLPEGAKLKAKK